MLYNDNIIELKYRYFDISIVRYVLHITYIYIYIYIYIYKHMYAIKHYKKSVYYMGKMAGQK